MTDVGVPDFSGRQFQIMPPPTLEEFEALHKSIAEHGVQVPIVKWGTVDDDSECNPYGTGLDNPTIDGHYREYIAHELGIDCPYGLFIGTRAEAFALALTLNIDRRHLNAKQKRELVAKSLTVQPDKSNVVHAKRTGTSDKTVAKVRSELESTSEIPRLDTTTGADGRKRPSSKRKQPASKPKLAKAIEPVVIDAEIVEAEVEVTRRAIQFGNDAMRAFNTLVAKRFHRDVLRQYSDDERKELAEALRYEANKVSKTANRMRNAADRLQPVHRIGIPEPTPGLAKVVALATKSRGQANS